MSGGSYNYLCFADSSELGSKQEEIQKMASRLLELGFDDEAKETKRIIDALRAVHKKAESLYHVWHAIEWMDSGDSGLEQVNESVSARRLKIARGFNITLL